ncbi:MULTISPECIES: non-ribosomal peptide synthetase [unclassified Xanthobacter]|uniref:non-ribosomal peptide synthetase n=1 Tax=unclassified Xanthobacter TaxID=2623496 RepID=UPI001EDCE709|nr:MULTISPECIES: non-ribosomal peptide synthetase [unclassified Xanthobacter]
MNEVLQKLDALSPERRQLLERKLLNAKRGNRAAPAALPRRGNPAAPLPLSFAQQRLWFMQQLDPGTVAYNMNLALRLEGPLDRPALARAFAALVARHDTLRTAFTPGADGTPLQVVGEPDALDLSYQDYRQAPDPEASARRHVEELVGTPYDLTRPPLRAALLQLSDDAHVLALGMHHIISDRWSMGVFARELSKLYEAQVMARPADLPDLAVQFADWTLWQRDLLAGPVLRDQLAYWTAQLAGELPVLELPFDRPRGAATSFEGRHLPVRLDRALALRLRTLAAQRNVTVFTLLLTAFKVLLHLYSDSDDIIVGSEVANRDRPETQTMIGPMVNTLVFRSDLSGDPTFEDLLMRVAASVRQGLAHQDIPFERLVEAINPERSLSELNPLFQVKFDIQHSIAPPPGLHDLAIAPYPLREVATKYELRFNLEDIGPDIGGKIEYACHLFDEDTIADMARRFERLLAMIVEAPQRRLSTLDLLSPDEVAAAVAAGAGPVREEAAGLCLHDLFRMQAGATPRAPAVTDGTVTWTYQELADRAAGIAAALVGAGVRPGHRVGICMRRSPGMIAGLLGILQSGGAYVPLDAEYPAERLAFIAQDAGLDILLSDHQPSFATGEGLQILDVDALPAARLAARPRVEPDDLAYIIYTSGSTGRPKGVAIAHRSVVAFMHWAQARFSRDEMAYMLVPTSISFDLSVFELFAPLVIGGALVVTEHFLTLPDLTGKVDVTFINTVPSLLQELLQTQRLPKTVKCATFCGEPLPASLVTRLRADYPHLHIHNLYGPSEDTVFSTEVALHGAGYDGGVVPIGRPLPNTRTYILDRAGRVRPQGVSGELHLAGCGLARGYFGRPAQTAERFLPDPFSSSPGARLYRTGDRVRHRADGLLEFLGRLDQQVKVRGLRIETGEIEHHLERIDGVAKAVVTVTGGADRQLAAFVEPDDGITLDEAALRRTLAQVLPAHMVPTLWGFITRLPQQPNGKIDRGALPAIADFTTGHKAPLVTDVERQVAAAWSDTLKVADIGRQDNFFKLGGHSLLAMRMIARLPFALPTKDVLRTLFEFPNLQDFAAAIAPAAGMSDPRQPSGGVSIPRLAEGEPIPLSFAQQRLWTLWQLEPKSPSYNVPAAIRLRGPLDRAALVEAFRRLSQRHEALRTRIVTDTGQPVIDVQPVVEPDVANRPSSDATLAEDLAAECRIPFDLQHAPLFRARIFAVGPQDHVVLIVIHHIVADAQSLELIQRDVTAFYNGLVGDPGQTQTPPLALRYADYAAWQRQQVGDDDLTYWRQQLQDAPRLLELPTDFPRGAQQEGGGDGVRLTLGADVTRRLAALASAHDATLFMAVLSAFTILLSRYSRSREVVIGTPISQRPDPAFEQVVGLFVNTLALKLAYEPDASFARQLERTRLTVLEGFQHQDTPFERVVDALAVPRDWSHNPVFQAMFSWQADTPRDMDPIGLESAPVSLPPDSAKVDLTLNVRHRNGLLDCAFIFRTDLFLPATITAMAEAFAALVETLVAHPHLPQARISCLPAKQRQQIQAWNDTAQQTPPAPDTLHGFFERSARRAPTAIAVTDRDRSLSYGALDQRANALARHLISRGIGRGACVGICLRRTVDLVAAMLAVLKTGAAYVPLDPNYPQERVAFIASDARLALLLTREDQPHFLGRETLDPTTIWEPTKAEASAGDDAPDTNGACGHDLAYVIYTSGSTGKPKGVAIEHGNAVAFTHWARETFSPQQLSGVLAATSVCFDLSIFEIFATLAAGGRVFMVEDLFELPDAAFADEITLINTVPTPMAELMRFGPLPPNARTVCLAGEPLPPSLAAAILADGAVTALHNLYGPSEDTTYSTGYRLQEPIERIHIGQPIANTQAHVLDEEMQEVPIGMPGELYLSGRGIARGYHHRPDLTAERFLPNPFATTGHAPVLYRTGDLVRRRTDGNIDYLGRCDRQMKISGFRIEPGEVEAVLLRYPGITGVAVDAWHDAPGHARLAAWIETPAPLAKAAVSAYLSEQLPRHLVPTLIALLAKLPRLPNGKLDRKALPDPTAGHPTTDGPHHRDDGAPRRGFEQILAAIWAKLLGRADIGRNDNFFALGGDSILAIQVVALARQQGIAIAPRQLFQHGTLAALAASVATLGAEQMEPGPVTGNVPLAPAQHWFFEQDFPEPSHWNQALLLRPRHRLEAQALQAAMNRIHTDHDALRARYAPGPDGWTQLYAPITPAPALRVVSCSEREAPDVIAAEANALSRSFDIADGPVWGAVLVNIGAQDQRLALAAHHLVIDGVSWRILLDDLRHCLEAEAAGEAPLPLRTSPVGAWVRTLADSDRFDDELGYWRGICEAPLPPPPADHPAGSNLSRDTAMVRLVVDRDTTQRLLHDAPAHYPVEADELMLAALYGALRRWSGQDRLRIILESHGRPDLFEARDLSRTVGWFTGLHPLLLEAEPDADTRATLLAVKDSLRRIPNIGIGYGVLKYLRGKALPRLEEIAAIRFNYLGQTDHLFEGDALFARAPEPAGEPRGGANPRGVLLDVNAIVSEGCLSVRWAYSAAIHDRSTIAELSEEFRAQLTALVEYCIAAPETGFTPADFPHMSLNQHELDDILRSL